MKTCIFLVFVLLCFQCKSLQAERAQTWIYSFHANTSVGNDLLTQAASQWTLSGSLNIISYTKYKIMQLQNLMTSSYNGPREHLSTVQELELPEDANILTESFVAYYDQNHRNLESIHFLPNEPVWSMNIKKAIASAYQLNYEINTLSNDIENNIEDEAPTEENIFGKCDLKYESDEEDTTLKIVKIIDVSKCKLVNTTRKLWQNTKIGRFTSKTVRNYFYNNKEQTNANNPAPFSKIISTTSMQYSKRTPDIFGQNLEQTISLNLEDSADPINTPDISKHIIVKSPVYEFDSLNQKTDLTGKELAENWLKYYDVLRKVLKRNHTEYYSGKTLNMFEDLYTTASSMDFKTLDFLDDQFNNESQMLNIFTSLMPFIGTESSVKYIKMRLEYEYFADPQALFVIIVFPFHLKDVNEKVLIEMERSPFSNMTHRVMHHTYILTFSNLVSRVDSLINKIEPEQELVDIVKRYIDVYYKTFLETEEPNTRINYLLGLGNMGSASIDYLISIVKNETETRHIRSLATYTVKPLIVDRRDIAFRTFWPIVKSPCEPYELRVAALTLLLESYLDSSEFYSIFMYMKKITDDPVELQLYNYFYTRLNCHKFWKQINYLADIFLADLQPPQATKGLMTGRYYAQYSDEEEIFRTSLDTHIVANPKTNIPNVFRVTFSDYINQNDKLNSFTLYVKAEGISQFYKEKHNFNMPIKELYNILKQYELNASTEDFYFEMVVYYNGKAVYAWESGDYELLKKVYFQSIFNEIFMYYADVDSMKFEYLDKNEFVTDLGTTVVSELKHENLLSSHMDMDGPEPPTVGNQTENYVEGNVKYMAIQKNDLKSLNPITNINHGVSTIYSLQRFLKFKVMHNLMDDLTIRWNEKDNLLEHVVDFKDAVFINTQHKDNREKYCSNCSSVYFLNGPVNEKVVDLFLFEMKTVNCTASEAPTLDVLYNSRIVNSGSPILNPLISLLYARDYYHYRSPYDTCSGMFYLATNKVDPKEFTLYIKKQFHSEKDSNNLSLGWNISMNLYEHRMSDKELVNKWFIQLVKHIDYERDTFKIVVEEEEYLLHIVLDSWLVMHHGLPAYDLFSLSTPPPITGAAVLSIHENETPRYKVEMKALFEVSETKKELINKSENYAKCLADSLGTMKHNAPTKACFDVSNTMSIYDDYSVNMEFYQRANIINANVSALLAQNITNDKDLPSIHKVLLKYSALDDMCKVFLDEKIIKNISIPKLYRYNLQPKSKFIQEVMYNTYGINSVCIISPHNVKTFLESNVPYESMFAKSMVPFIQCSNNTRIGLVTTVEDYQISFRFWYDDHIFEMTSQNLTINGNEVNQDQNHDLYKVMFYDDTFVIITKMVTLYYNQDYVAITIQSLLIPDMCGTCSSDELTASNIPELLYRIQ